MNLLEFFSYWSHDSGCFLGPWLFWARLSYPCAQLDVQGQEPVLWLHASGLHPLLALSTDEH